MVSGAVDRSASNERQAPGAVDRSASNEVWRELYAYAWPRLAGLACQAHLEGMARLEYGKSQQPQLERVQQSVREWTGWELVRAHGEVPAPKFFELLSRREFPLVFELRPLEQIYASVQPDLWHELLGHAPLLLNREIAALYEWFGRAGVAAHMQSATAFEEICKLYWFTAEYGLVRQGWKTKIMGAGLLASPLGPDSVRHRKVKIRRFTIRRVLVASYNPYQYQGLLFRVASISSLHRQLRAAYDKRLGLSQM
ncbi:MAG: hypothetical protein HY074_11960 [Deltaproteobacteria bacterium]|nr:hypothetical protein [Deltaproteobacteria bacterium]